MIQPYLSYCNIIWGGAAMTTLEKLFKLQKRAIRLITHSRYRAHTSLLFKQHHILKLWDIYKLQLSLFVYKHQNRLLPPACMHLIVESNNHCSYALRVASNIIKLPFKTKIRENHIGISGPRLWEILPDRIKEPVGLILATHRLTAYF